MFKIYNKYKIKFFKNISRVKPGYYYEININNSNIKETCYWAIPEISNSGNKKESYYLEKLDFLLNKCIKSQMISDVPIGVFLSGGLDSSLISSIANKHSKNTINTFSVRFDETGYDESDKTELMKNYLKTNHHNVTITKKDFLITLRILLKLKRLLFQYLMSTLFMN